jgi:hypothetical protein
MEDVGTRAYRTSSSPTTITFKIVGRWHRPRCYMIVGAEPRLFWNEMGRRNVFGPDILQEDERQVRMVERGLVDFTVKTRVTPTIGEEN